MTDLLDELESDRDYLTGDRPFPRRVTTDEALAALAELGAYVDASTDERELAAARAGTPISCARGCDRCCGQLIMLFPPEIERVIAWLREPAQEEIAERFLAAYPAWRARIGDAPERLRRLSNAGDRVAMGGLYIELYKKGIKCAFLHEGACSIYPVRPLICRFAHAIGDPQRCDPNFGPPPEAFDFVPVDRLRERTTPLMQGLGLAMGRKAEPRSLCVEVHAGLTGQKAAPPATVGRNDPCPCGSGKKHKKCCGA
jgi:Fe-S-cluster containining protein